MRLTINQRWIYGVVVLSLLPLTLMLGSIGQRPDPVTAQSGGGEDHTAWGGLSAQSWAKIAPPVWEAMGAGSQDFLVVLEAQADLSAAGGVRTKEAKGRFVYNVLQATAQRTQAPLRAVLDAQGVPYRSFYVVNALQVTGGRDVVFALAERPEVARIVANPRVQMNLPQPGTRGASQRAPSGIEWNISKIGAPEVWAMGYTGQGVVVAGQDTGYDWDHPALKSQYRGWDGASVNHNYHWHDAVHDGGGACGPDAPAPCDDYGHGTHTLGTMVGDDGADRQIGVAPGARWIGCRNMDRGVGTPATYIECFEFFLAPYALGGTSANGRPDLAPDVIGNSWSCPPSEGCDWHTLQAVVEAVRAAGIMVAAAAGNSGPSCSTVRDPIGLYDAAYTIGATNSGDGIASFSGRGPVTVDGSQRLKPDIVAPGVSVLSSRPGDSYGLSNGTSMATPHVVGAAALLWSACPALRGHVSQTEQLLNATTVPLYSTQCDDAPDTSPNNVYGWGRLDALAAVQRAVGGSLRGSVVSAGSEKPLMGAVIHAQLSPDLSWETFSGAEGGYALSLVAGTYTVTASAADHLPYLTTGITVVQAQTTTLDIVLDPCEPVQSARVVFTPTMPHPHDIITLTASLIGGTPPITYAWSLAPGVHAQGATVTTTYGARGVYPVTLTVTSCGIGITVSRQVTVTAPEIAVAAPKLEVVLREAETTSRAVTITNAGDYPLGWGVAISPTVDWLHLGVMPPSSFRTYARQLSPAFSIRTTSLMPLAPQQTAVLSMTFDTLGLTPGGYTSTLVITSTDSARPYIALPVTLGVNCEPVGGLRMHRTPYGDLWAGERVTFTADVLSGTLPITYTWRFGDGTLALGDRVVHTYPVTGSTRVYSVTLEATNPCQISRHVVHPITVKARRWLYLPWIIRNAVRY